MNNKAINSTQAICLLTGHFFLSNFFFLVAIALIGFLFSISVTAYHFPISIILSAFYIYIINNKTAEPITLYSLVILGISCTISSLFFMYILKFVYDISWDGTEYHQQAIVELKNGWNPLYSPFKGLNSSDIFVFSYAKAAWFAEAALYSFYGNIQAAKALHLTMMVGAAAFVSGFLLSLKKIKTPVVFIIGFAVAFNPVTIAQFFTFYLDGILYSCIVCMVVLLISFYLDNKKTYYIPGLFFCIHLVSTLKFTGLIYAIILSFFFIVANLLPWDFKKTVRLSLLFLFMHLSVLFTTGYNPYITNTTAYHHPFYPLNTLKIPSCAQIPEEFCEYNRVYAFFYSIFSKTQNKQSPEYANLKIPFTDSVDEVSLHPIADSRVGGFGVWFSGMFVLSLLLLCDIVRHEKFALKSPFYWLVFLIFALLVSVFINPHPWWARYVPQFYLFPFLIIIYSFLYRATKFFSRVRTLLLIAMLLNFYLTFEGMLLQNLPKSAVIRAQIEEIKLLNKEVVLCSNALSTSARLRDQGIKVTVLNDKHFYSNNPSKLEKLELVLPTQDGSYYVK